MPRSLFPVLLAAALSGLLLAAGAGCRSGEALPVDAAHDPDLPGLTATPELSRRLHEAVAARGPSYRPRTRHLREDGSPRFTNRLILEHSPYLLQHAHNPVSWFAWSQAAFDRARAQNKPVLLSIGYSTCHWCHVMERESFEDEEIARVLNERFIAVKVDREERPDIDDLYMTALLMLRGNGGWPMTLVLTPDKQPFFAASYIPARDGDRGASQGFLTILQRLADAYANDRDGVVAQAAEVSAKLAQAIEPAPPAGVPGLESLDAAASQLAARFDAASAGFGRGPKFPQPSILELLLRHHERTGNAASLQMVVSTLEAMAGGGIRDHVGGGFHRYTVDARWRVPHFEKMLYDNAQLASVYLDAFQVTGRQDFADIAREILYYVAREMTSPQGAFYSATDADSLAPGGHEEEGRFFTWTPQEVRAVLGEDDARPFLLRYGISDAGNLEGRTVLAHARPLEDLAAELGRSAEDLELDLTRSRARLYLARSERTPPLLDDKIVASWNGLMISAMARASFVLGEPEHAERAAAAADHVLAAMRDGKGRLFRVLASGHAGQVAVLDDYAFLIQALLDLFEATGEPRRLREATALQQALDTHYADPAGGYFLTPADGEALPARSKPSRDGAEPAGNSVAAQNLLRLAELTQDQVYLDRGRQLLAAFGSVLAQQPMALPRMLCAVDYLAGPVREVVLVGTPSDPGAADLAGVLRRTFLPRHVFVPVSGDEAARKLAASVPIVEGKTALDGRPTAYVCERGRCERPAQDPSLLASQLGRSAVH